MDFLPWGSPDAKQFITNIGLITSNGPLGHNIMTAEWIHHVSYEPSLIMINLHEKDTTSENIKKTKEFGINIASETQNVVASVAGGSSGAEVDKIAILRDLGVEFYKAKKINVLMVKGAALNAECKVIKQELLGDHMMFVGEVVEASSDENIKPLMYYGSKYWKVGDRIMKPQQDILDKIGKLVEKHRK